VYSIPVLRPIVSVFLKLDTSRYPADRLSLLPRRVVVCGRIHGRRRAESCSRRDLVRYLCPLGGLLGLLSKSRSWAQSINRALHRMRPVYPKFPTSTIDPDKGYEDSGQCTMGLESWTAGHRLLRLPARRRASEASHMKSGPSTSAGCVWNGITANQPVAAIRIAA